MIVPTKSRCISPLSLTALSESIHNRSNNRDADIDGKQHLFAADDAGWTTVTSDRSGRWFLLFTTWVCLCGVPPLAALTFMCVYDQCKKRVLRDNTRLSASNHLNLWMNLWFGLVVTLMTVTSPHFWQVVDIKLFVAEWLLLSVCYDFYVRFFCENWVTGT